MSLLLSLAFRNALRNRLRSALTMSMVLVGVGLLVLGLSWINGMFGGIMRAAADASGHVHIVTETYAKKEALQPLIENIADTKPVVDAIAKVPGVTHVWPRIMMGVTGSANDEIGEHFGMLQGAPMDFYTDGIKVPDGIIKGRMLAADDEAVVGVKFAEQMGAELDKEIVLLGLTQDGSISPIKVKVVGIADLGAGAYNRMAFVTLAKMQYMADMDGGAVELMVFGDDFQQAPALAAAIRTLPEAKGLEVKAWSERPPFDSLIGFIFTIRVVLASVIVFITALGVLNTMLMSVLERTAEIGVLRAMGLKARDTVVLFMAEAMGISVVGGLLGALFGGLGGYALQVHGVNLGDAVSKAPDSIPVKQIVYAQVSPDILVLAVVLGLIVALIGSAVPAFRATRIQPVEAMRSRR